MEIRDPLFLDVVDRHGEGGNYGIGHPQRDLPQARLEILHQVKLYLGMIAGDELLPHVPTHHGDPHPLQIVQG